MEKENAFSKKASGAPESRQVETLQCNVATSGKTEGDNAGSMSASHGERLISELQFKHAELEIQKEALIQTKAELAAGLELFSQLYEMAPVGYFIMTRDSAVLQVNLTGAQFMGVERDALIGSRFVDFVADRDRRIFINFLGELFAGGDNHCCEVMLMNVSSPVFVCIEAKMSSDGRECRTVIHDVTEQRLAEEAVQRERFRLKKILDALPEGMYILNDKYEFEFTNAALKRSLGIPGNRHCYAYLYDRTEPCPWCNNDDVFAGKTVKENRFLEKTGCLYELYAAPFYNDDGSMSKFQLFHDITELRQAEEHEIIKRKFEAMETLSGWLNHDMNNMLAGLFGCMEIALDNAGDSASVEKWIKKGLMIAETAKELMIRFRKMAPAAAYNKKTVCLSALIEANIPQPKAGDTVHICFNCGDGLQETDLDVELIDSVIKIIIENAVEAMPDGGMLNITAENVSKTRANVPGVTMLPDGDYVKVTFKDTGCGISENNLKRIFDPYFSTKKRGSQKGQGLSLGLAYSIIKQHKGHIAIRSKQGYGAEVTIWLPVFKQVTELEISRAQVAEAVRKGSRRVLVLDDEPFMREMVGEMLDIMGMAYELVSRGEDAVDCYFRALENKRAFGLIILDLTIKGGMGGLETLAVLKEKDPEVKAVVMSGYSEDPVVVNYKQHGFYAALTKPFQMADFERIVKAAMQ